jgi:hypothetical protein
MKAASILLALVVVLGFVSEARATSYGFVFREHSYTIGSGENCVGFADGFYGLSKKERWSRIYLGRFGSREVHFSATQGLIGFCIILATLIIVPVVLTVRWKKKREK